MSKIKDKTITLVMIVKNESKVITRCFDSVKDYIDYWVICDTGSTDGTPKIIKKYFKKAKIPGELHNHKWKNFGHNRSLAIKAAKNKSDYSLLLDADFVFIIKDKNFKQNLNADGYQIKYEGGLDYRQMLFVKSSLDWKYIGVTHEYLSCGSVKNFKNLDAFTIYHKCDGGSRSDKFTRDIELLSQGVKDEPDNQRYMFYLAQSYKDTKQYTNAIKWYKERVKRGGWPEEVYYALFQIGNCKKMRGDSFDDFKEDFWKAYLFRPTRLEALYELVRYCRLNGMADLGFNYGMVAVNNEYPKDILFISRAVHEWMFYDELALCAYNIHKGDVAIQIYNKIMPKGVIPKIQVNRFKANYGFFKKQILEDRRKAEEALENTKKVAIIIVNYNMKERADAIIDNLKKTVKHPHDIILVDNGSDLVEKSENTMLALKKNVQTTNGWLMGLHYADSLEIINNEKYFAYCFVITSTEMVEENKDIIAEMVKTMKDDDSVVGVHPSLTRDSTTHWKNMLHTPGKGKQEVYFVDNIFSCYRASWFNKIGRFDSSLTYAWGIDMETGYFSYKDSKKIILDNNIQVGKETDVGYKLNRMNMSASERRINASKQIEEYFKKKYGAQYQKLIYRRLGFKADYVKPPPKPVKKEVKEPLPTIKENEGVEGVDYVKKNLVNKIPFARYIKEKQLETEKKVMVEVGCTRNLTEQDSTFHLANFCKKNDIHFVTVDVNEDNIKTCKERLKEINPEFEAVASTGEEFLKKYDKKIDFLYLDGFDYFHNFHSQGRKDNYKKYLGLEITDENCWNMHLNCVKNSTMSDNGIICINNVLNNEYAGKGKLAIPYLMKNNYEVDRLSDQCAILVKSKPKNVDLKIIEDESDNKQPLKPTPDTIKKVEVEVKKVKVNEVEVKDEPKPVEITEDVKVDNVKSNFDANKFTIVLLGYKGVWGNSRHTNWYPWNRFEDAFKTLNYEVKWMSFGDFVKWDDRSTRRIFICWNDPTSIELIKSKCVTKDDIILQKLTSLGKGMNDVNWGNDPKTYFKDWSWPLYKTVEHLYDLGFNIYGFGCKTITEPFPEKDRICKKLKDRIFWITWGSTVYNQQEVKDCKPIMDNFKYDVGYVGSKWGKAGRGNTDQWGKFIEPLLTDKVVSLWGSGLQGQISDEKTKVILSESKLCPIIHAPSWVAERGIQDRFYTVFTTGRFGVVDNEGVYDLFDTDEVVCEVDPEKYVEKSLYYMDNVKEQFPYIEKIQKKIKEKYNFYDMWENIIENVKKVEYNIDDANFVNISKEVGDIKTSFVME